MKKKTKKKLREPTMRSIPLSIDNHNAAIESFLFSLRMIDGDEKVIAVQADKSGKYLIHLEKTQETIN